MTSYVLNASNGTVEFTPSKSGKTVRVLVDKHAADGGIPYVKTKRLRTDKARALYKSLLSKGYKKS